MKKKLFKKMTHGEIHSYGMTDHNETHHFRIKVFINGVKLQVSCNYGYKSWHPIELCTEEEDLGMLYMFKRNY